MIIDKAKLQHMFELQKELDNRILGEKPYPIIEMHVAAMAELGEALQCVEPIFKHWKKQAKIDRESFLREMVDCIHFAISIDVFELNGDSVEDEVNSIVRRCSNFMFKYELSKADKCRIILRAYTGNWVVNCFQICNAFGFTFDEIYSAYLEKNAINHKRQDEGY